MNSPAPTGPPCPSRAPHSIWSSNVAILTYIAVATIVVHLFTGERYGFHRDELATLEDARHLAWGFVAYPPITPFFGRLSLILFGTSLTGFRFFAAVVEAIAVVLTGLMARELGGKRGAQLVAATAALPVCIGGGSLMQYVAFDYFFWVLTAYFVVHLLRTDDPRWWLAIGASIGLGMEAKYTMGFFALAVVGALVLTSLPQIQMALVRCGTLHSGFTSQSSLAGPASFRFACLPPAHPHPRCTSRPHQVFSPRSIKVHDLYRPALALRPVLLSHFP